MTVIQNLVSAAAAFVTIAPPAVPAEPSREQVAAFRRYRYWQLRWYGLKAGPAAFHAKADTTRFVDVAPAGRWDAWETYRGTALHWADRPARIKAAELAAGNTAPVH